MSHSAHATIIEQQNDIYYGTEVLNRVSFLREDPDFITDSVGHASARFIFYENTNPLVNSQLDDKLVLLTNGDNQLEGPQVCKKGLQNLQQWTQVVETWAEANKNHDASMRAPERPTFLFLGLQDESVGLDLKSLKAADDGESEHYLDHQGRYQGIPYYAVDVTNAPTVRDLVVDFYNSEINNNNQSAADNDVIFTAHRKHHIGFTNTEASLFSHGRMFLDWLARNRFCPGCGSKVIPVHAGGKLKCTNSEASECPVQSATVSNVSFPRTDAVIITAITNTDRTKVLLSLAKRHAHTNMYACTAGFMEPSETVEIATKREIWEETGVVCKKINVVLTQPWPFPGNLMIGCIGEVEFDGESEVVNLGHDRELSDARWFDIEFVRKLIYKNEVKDGEDFNPENILLPFPESIAHSLIKLAVDQAGNKGKL
ncbi:uncharacterized protein CANTADRAFT_45522 [Suhomyces tanzawaensis NRRL Y-17324]|uniref:NAD(+) diphosphatase n=1 Tax=Suhomyces tanzawaensis NRRL Y-17324 TaxID=984487 RepID=A0A1E4SR90_9ASCO|nr:uncharacterized protein CANTADRAFT_45522 [Suhomyces tanzawaensis NRRL Y-17324]ODV81922.1 hypothetical protein CANTADRAFT_45522 [Suhomyces tanzawaensis NRRL Y-17324]